MLPPAERDIAKRDPALPGLALLLNGERLAQRLGLRAIARPYLRYKPGTKCVLAFGTGAEARVAMAYPPDRYRVLRGRKSLLEAGNAVLFLDDLCIAILPATLDRDLRALARLAEPPQRQQLLGRLLGARAAGTTLHLLRHNPNRRAVLRLDAPQGPVALGKVHAKGEWGQALENAYLAEARGGARVLGMDEERRLILHEWIDGRPLWSEDAGLAETAAIAAAGAALARLHRTDPGTARAITATDERDELAAAAQALAWLLPALDPPAEALARRVATSLADDNRTMALLHGDFSADQVLIGENGPVLIDWDRAAAGDPARDLGSFLARLDVQVIDGDLSTADAAAAAQALMAGYAAETRPPPGIAAQHARALLALLSEGFRQRRPAWPERATAILNRAEALLPLPDVLANPLDGLLAQAKRSGPLIAAAAGLPAGAVTEGTLLRHKPGRRALLRYRVQDSAPALLGKLRAKGPDRRTPRLHTALRDAGLDGRAPHRVGVPRPRGIVEGLHLWLQDEVPGSRITDHLRPGCEPKAAFRAGAALARLHATTSDTARRWTLDDEIAVLERALEEAAVQLPSERMRLRGLLDTCSRAADLPCAPETGIHRDWYPDQALLDGDTVWILDLDLYARGDPSIDLGNFLAHITELSIRRHGSPHVLSAHETAFRDGYTAGEGQFDAPRVALLKALSLARLVAVSLRIADRRAATGDILSVAEEEIRVARTRLNAPSG